MKYSKEILLAIVVAVATMHAVVLAHELTVRGTVAAIETERVQIKPSEGKAGQSPAWYPIDAKTKIKRGTNTVTLAEAKIAIGERVVAIVDHPTKGPMTTKEIRLAPQTSGRGGSDAK